jgi:putative SOS response-associated peptidase YedK
VFPGAAEEGHDIQFIPTDIPGHDWTERMCGRYVSPDEAAIEREYQVDRTNSRLRLDAEIDQAFLQSFNVAPTNNVPVVRVIRGRNGEREAVLMRWGLIPFFARGEPPKYSTINATIEKLDTAPAWRGSWERGQRCVMPCAGFYEWKVMEDGRKQPFYIKPANEETFAFAALWDKSITAGGEVIVSCAVITMPANELLRDIHNSRFRMPAILRHEHIETWLSGTPQEARAVLLPFPSDEMLAWPVSPQVNAPRNNGPELILPWRGEAQGSLL